MSVLARDFFSDPELVEDPTPYYAALRELGPVVREPQRGVFMVSGLDELMELYANDVDFSSIIAPLGPFARLPEPAPGESLPQRAERRRAEIPLSELIVTLDGPQHSRERALLNRLFTPGRVRESEAFMRNLADDLIDEFAPRGEVEFCRAYAEPFALLVIADLLGVPPEQRETADELRLEPERIRNFVEECLRLEGPVKGTFRLALRDTRLAGVEIPAGSVVMALNGAANRDPRVFDAPDHFDAKRANARRNLAFGHGAHFCAGANLARSEACISFERLLDRLDDLRLADPSALRYVPSFILRGVQQLPIRFSRRR